MTARKTSNVSVDSLPLRVLVLNQFAVPDGNPGGTRHVEMFSRIASCETAFVVGSINYFSSEPIVTVDERFRIVRMRPWGKSLIQRVCGWIEYSCKAVFGSLREQRIDVVYASTPHLLAPVAGWVIAKLKRARLVVEVRDLWPESFVALGAIRRGGFLYRVLSVLERWIYRRADWIVGVSDEWRAYFSTNAPGKPYTPIPNGTDVEAFDVASAHTWEDLFDEAPPSGIKFVFAGSHGPKDGLDLLLDVVIDFPEDLFVLIGDGTDKEKIRRRIAAENLSNVLLLPPVPKSELPRYLKMMDVGLHLVSDWEIFKKGMSPNKLHDYLGAALPVISNAEGEPHRILSHAGAGVGVGANDIRSGLKAMKELTLAERAAMGERGRAWMLQNRSRPIVARNLEYVLRSVMSGTKLG